jgi:hypothetical protein
VCFVAPSPVHDGWGVYLVGVVTHGPSGRFPVEATVSYISKASWPLGGWNSCFRSASEPIKKCLIPGGWTGVGLWAEHSYVFWRLGQLYG